VVTKSEVGNREGERIDLLAKALAEGERADSREGGGEGRVEFIAKSEVGEVRREIVRRGDNKSFGSKCDYFLTVGNPRNALFLMSI
jgi:hypothetical protein